MSLEPRSYGGEFTLISQSISDFERKFSKDLTRTLVDNCTTKQWLGFSEETAKRASEAMGEEYALSSSLGSNSGDTKTQTNLSLTKQRVMTASELMAMPKDEQLVHIMGVGFFVCKKIGQQNIAPYCFDMDENPLEGGKLTPDPMITLTKPEVL